MWSTELVIPLKQSTKNAIKVSQHSFRLGLVATVRALNEFFERRLMRSARCGRKAVAEMLGLVPRKKMPRAVRALTAKIR